MNPLFQHPYVLSMQCVFLAGLLAASFLLILLKRKSNPYLLAILPLFVLTFHQVDEYILSPLLLGNEYHFLNWSFRSGIDISPLEVVIINLIGYVVASLPFLFKPETKPFALVYLFGAGILLSNGMFHLGGATMQSDYSPGMATALFLFLPLYIKSVLLAAERMVSFKLIFTISLYGSIAHFAMIWLIN